MRAEEVRNLKTTEMRMLQMIRGKILKDKINETIREITVVERLEELLREQRLQWLGHVESMNKERDGIEVDGTKKDQKRD